MFEFFIIIKKNFWPHRVACGLLAPWPGIQPMPSALEVQNLNHRNTREVPQSLNLNVSRQRMYSFNKKILEYLLWDEHIYLLALRAWQWTKHKNPDLVKLKKILVGYYLGQAFSSCSQSLPLPFVIFTHTHTIHHTHTHTVSKRANL